MDEAPVEEKTPLVDETLVVDETTSNDTSDDEITPDLEEESSSETQDSELVPEEETDNQENSELDEEKEVITDELSEDKTSVDETPIVDGDNNEVGENLTYEELADDLETTDFESENSNLLANEERFAVSKVSDLALNLNQNNSVRLASVKDATKEENKQWQITRNKPETKSEEKIEEQENTAVLLPPVNSISEDELETLSQDIQTVITSKESKPSPVIKKLEAVKTEVEKVSPWYKALAAFASLSVLGTCVGFGVKKLHKH